MAHFLRTFMETKTMKYFALALMTLLFVSCGSTVAVDYEKGTDWNAYKGYQFYTEMDTGLNALDNNRIIDAADSILQKRGLQRTDYNDFFINFYVEESLSNSRNTLGIGVGSGGGNVSVGGGVGIPIGGKVVNQRITIEFIEAQVGGKLIWQAVYNGELKEKATPRQKKAYYNKVIAKILAEYPPKNKTF